MPTTHNWLTSLLNTLPPFQKVALKFKATLFHCDVKLVNFELHTVLSVSESPFHRLDVVNLHSDRVPAPLAALHEHADHVVEDGDEGAPDVGAAQAVDVEVERKVQQLQVVGYGTEHLAHDHIFRLVITKDNRFIDRYPDH